MESSSTNCAPLPSSDAHDTCSLPPSSVTITLMTWMMTWMMIWMMGRERGAMGGVACTCPPMREASLEQIASPRPEPP
eukprot:3531450-Rhodomonas_salina.1